MSILKLTLSFDGDSIGIVMKNGRMEGSGVNKLMNINDLWEKVRFPKKGFDLF
jgi:hypothetical protein